MTDKTKSSQISFDNLDETAVTRVYYTSCVECGQVSKKIYDILTGILNPSHKEKIIINIYYSIYCWMQTAIALNHPMHFQAMAAVARAIFEQVLDLKLITSNSIEKAVEKFEKYPEVEKFKWAKKAEQFIRQNPSYKKRIGKKKVEVALSSEWKNKIESYKTDCWGIKKRFEKDHWSNIRIEKRCDMAGVEYQYFYNESYGLLCWYIHSGLVGVKGMSDKTLLLMYANAMRLIYELFLEAISMTAKEFKIDSALIDYESLISNLKLVPGFAIIKEHETLNQKK